MRKTDEEDNTASISNSTPSKPQNCSKMHAARHTCRDCLNKRSLGPIVKMSRAPAPTWLDDGVTALRLFARQDKGGAQSQPTISYGAGLSADICGSDAKKERGLTPPLGL